MADILELTSLDDRRKARAAEVLEAGGLVLLPNLPFTVEADDGDLTDPGVLSPGTKNVSFDPATGEVGGTALEGESRARLARLVSRYSAHARAVVEALAPAYLPHLQQRRTSFRPAAIENRALSPRKDDKRLHVDAFPSSPVQGRRIFRVFTNADPDGGDRVWKVGDQDFQTFAEGFRSRIRPRAGGWWRERVGLTRGRRTAYDSAMLQLHDQAKLDDAWQASAPHHALSLPAGSTWVVYTDSVLHAALSGRGAFEQTWLMPVEAMADPERSPLRILERLTGRALV